MPLDLRSFSGIYLHRDPVDMRKWIGGLSIIVEKNMKLDPFSKYLFVFCNKKKNRLKILYWDETGFAIWFKALDAEKFKWPTKLDDAVVSLTSQELQWLLRGIDLTKITPHKKLNYESVY